MRTGTSDSQRSFNEITPKAQFIEAVENPGRINQHIVDAQQARRILDRLVGYQVPPLLWDKVRRGISAGRVQTVALRLIVERSARLALSTRKSIGRSSRSSKVTKPPPFDARLQSERQDR